MTKTYLLEEAKELVKNGTHQVHNNCPEKLEILQKIFEGVRGKALYYAKHYDLDYPKSNTEIIPLSAIEDIRWGDEVQGSDDTEEWSQVFYHCCKNPKDDDYIVVTEDGITEFFKHIRKPAPNFSSLIQSTQEAADKIAKGYVVKIEKL